METRLTIYQWLEDHDNSELSEDEWWEQMEEAVEAYNQEYGTEYAPRNFVRNYKGWLKERFKDDTSESIQRGEL